jgi:NADH dehydrogenase (ubiquinone) Fe-S protein 1
MITVFINNSAVAVNKDLTVLQACESVFAQVPVFCYHEKLSIAGNCRMCLVEIEKSPKPVASCAMPLLPNMKIYTETPLVKKAREAVLEFLLLNHPLDCPICDQGGECDLQDQSMVFGSDRSRFYEFKHSVKDKNCGPLIKTIMTRCIHCTRCVRFASEVLGVEDLGMTGRGNSSEIGLYVEKIFQSELSGNVIDLCPVGALTAKPYVFTARSWELQINESIDISDSLGSNILVYSRDSEIMRILPKFNAHINEEWISDKTRFSYDGLQRQRLGFPMVKIDGKLHMTDWPTAFKNIKLNLKGVDSSQIGGVCSNLTDLESAYSFKAFFEKLGISQVSYDHGFKVNTFFNSDFQFNYTFNTSFKNLDKADVCLFVGVDLRKEGAVLNTRLRRKCLDGDLDIASIGPSLDLTYPYNHLGLTFETFLEIVEGRHAFCTKLKQAKNPVIIFGLSFLNNFDSSNFQVMLQLLESKLFKLTSFHGTCLNFLHLDSSFVNSLEAGFVNLNLGIDLKILFLLNYEGSLFHNFKDKPFIIYQGAFWEINAKKADIVLPSTIFIEQGSLLINTEGRSQQTAKILNSPGIATDSWKIYRGLSEILIATRKTSVLEFKSVKDVRFLIYSLVPSSLSFDKFVGSSYNFLGYFFKTRVHFKSVFKGLVKDFYRTNTIARLSKTMSKCSRATRFSNFIEILDEKVSCNKKNL